jgi:hypothetical protein
MEKNGQKKGEMRQKISLPPFSRQEYTRKKRFFLLLERKTGRIRNYQMGKEGILITSFPHWDTCRAALLQIGFSPMGF